MERPKYTQWLLSLAFCTHEHFYTFFMVIMKEDNIDASTHKHTTLLKQQHSVKFSQVYKKAIKKLNNPVLSSSVFVIVILLLDNMAYGHRDVHKVVKRLMRKLCDKAFNHPLYFLGQQPSPLPDECVKKNALHFLSHNLRISKALPHKLFVYKLHRIDCIATTLQRIAGFLRRFFAQGCHLVALLLPIEDDVLV